VTEDERQLAVEGAQRLRVGICAVVAGFMLFAGDLWASAIESSSPTVGLLQGLSPALHGMAVAHTDPRTLGLQFLVHDQFPLLASSLVAAIGAVVMTFPLRYLAAAERARTPTSPSAVTGYLAAYAPLVIAIFVPVFEISLIIGAHNYLSGSARTAAAVTSATGGGLRVALQLIVTVGELALAAAFLLISMRSMRVGLLTRMLGIVGMISGVLFVIPLTPLPVVQALWLVFVGAMFLGFGGRQLPEAWTVLEARPWPSSPPRERRPRPQRTTRGLRSSSPPAPEPVVQRGPSPSASKKRKQRRN
jgi:hypothetical protein